MAQSTFGVPMIEARETRPVLPMSVAAVRTTEINVIFTTLGGTVAAIRVAAALSHTSGASVRLIDPRLVRYPLRAAGYALACAPDISLEEREREHVVAFAGVPVEVLVYKCGRITDAARVALRKHSLVVLGGRRSWFPTKLERLRRALESLGHVVMFVDEADHAA